MKYADKIGARFSMVLGDNELAEKKATVKNMATGENAEVTLDGEPLKQFLYNAGLDGLSDSLKGTLGGILENMGTNPAPEGKE